MTLEELVAEARMLIDGGVDPKTPVLVEIQSYSLEANTMTHEYGKIFVSSSD